jgi:hypothetical protein
MPRHAFRFPPHVRSAVKRHVQIAVSSVDPRRYKQEHAYCAALARALEGIAYDSTDAKVEFRSTVVSDRGRGAAERWSGADLAITADVSDRIQEVRKAILIQAKRGALNDLPSAQADRAPKVMEIPPDVVSNGPGIYSATVYSRGDRPVRYPLDDYIVRRVLTTLDGDTRPDFVSGVQDSDLTTLKVYAHSASVDTT